MTIGDAAEQIVGQHFFALERVAAPFQPRQIEQIADDRFELVRLLVGDVEIALRASSSSSFSSGMPSVST